jgi:hypothetical protein
MDRALFDAVQQKLTDQWTNRSTVRNASDHLLTGLLFDDVGHRMVPTHATKAGVRYRYYVSLPHLHGESKTASVGSVSRVPATDIENILVKSLNEHLIAQKEKPTFNLIHIRDGKAALEQIARIDVHEDRLAVRLKSADDEQTTDAADDHLLSIQWQKPPSRRSRQILVSHGIPKNEIRPTRIERRARLASAIARGRRWLDEIVSGSVTDVQQIASRQKCSVRQVNMTISLAFRRYAVFDVNDKYSDERSPEHKAYWEKLQADFGDEAPDDGRSAMLFDLLRMDLSNFNVRAVPNSTAKTEQKLLSLKGAKAWLYSILQEAAIGHEKWNEAGAIVSKDQAYSHYEAFSKQRREWQPETRDMWSKAIHAALGPTVADNRLKRPLSRGSSPAGYPAEPLVSYQINRQLSGWNLPPLMIRAFGAHCH